MPYKRVVLTHYWAWNSVTCRFQRDPAVDRAAAQLMNDMDSFGYIRFLGIRIPLRSQQRATWPNKYVTGLQEYLDRRGVPLTARSTWGWGPATWNQSLNILRSRYALSTPEAVVAFEGSISTQHMGMTEGFSKDPFGGLHANLLVDLRSRTELNLSPWWTLAGVYWLEED